MDVCVAPLVEDSDWLDSTVDSMIIGTCSLVPGAKENDFFSK